MPKYKVKLINFDDECDFTIKEDNTINVTSAEGIESVCETPEEIRIMTELIPRVIQDIMKKCEIHTIEIKEII